MEKHEENLLLDYEPAEEEVEDSPSGAEDNWLSYEKSTIRQHLCAPLTPDHQGSLKLAESLQTWKTLWSHLAMCNTE